MAKTPSKAFGAERAQKPHLIRGTGGIQAEVADVRADAEVGFQNAEAREGYPELDWIDGGNFSQGGGTVVLRGRNLLQGMTFDQLTLGAGTSQVDYIAVVPGATGYKVRVRDTGSLTVSFSAGLLDITIQSGVTTADALATAVNAEATAKGIIRAVSGGAGTALVLSTDQVNGDPLAGGVGDHAGSKVEVSGVLSRPLHATGTAPAANWADDVISITVPALTGETPARATGDLVAIRVQSNGVWSGQIQAELLI